MGYALADPAARSRAATSPSTTARAPRPSRSPSSARRSSTRPPTWPTATSCSRWSPGPTDFKEVVLGDDGLLSRPDAAPARDRRLLDGLAGRVRRGPGRRPSARGVALLAAPVSGNPSVVDAGKLTVVVSGPSDAWEAARPYLELFGAGATYVGDGDARPARQDLPQPDARRGGAVAGRDHGARREGRRLARGVPRVPQQERDGLDVHALQDAGDRQPRLHADLHARRCSTRTSTSASRPPRSTACRCRSPRPPSRPCRR